MKREEFLKLVTDFGDARFECGMLEPDYSAEYEALLAKQKEAEDALVGAVDDFGVFEKS